MKIFVMNKWLIWIIYSIQLLTLQHVIVQKRLPVFFLFLYQHRDLPCWAIYSQVVYNITGWQDLMIQAYDVKNVSLSNPVFNWWHEQSVWSLNDYLCIACKEGNFPLLPLFLDMQLLIRNVVKKCASLLIYPYNIVTDSGFASFYKQNILGLFLPN